MSDQTQEIKGSEELNATLMGYELESEKQLVKEYPKGRKTILDESLGDIMSQTLDFMKFSGDAYMKKVYEAEDKKKGSSSVSPYLLGFAMFCTETDNAIYLGILLLMVSVIIYFMSIVSNDQVSGSP